MRFSSLLILLLLGSSVQAADPKWIYGGDQGEYQADKYLTAIGEGGSSEDARKNAISRLAEQLKVSISSQSHITKEYQSTSENFSSNESMQVRIKTEVNLENIEGIRIANNYFQQSTNTYFAFAILDRVKNATRLGFEIESQFDNVRTKLGQVKALLAKGDHSEGIILLMNTSQLFEGITSNIELHQLFANAGVNSLLKDNVLSLISQFDSYLAEVFRQVRVSVVSGNHQAGSPELGVSEPYRINYTFNGKPLKQVPVNLVIEDVGTLIEADSNTNQQGELMVRVKSFPYSGNSENKIKAGLDFFDELFINASPFAELVILLSQKSEISIMLKSKISSPHNDFLYLTVNDGLSSVLSEHNYHVISEDDSGSRPDYIIEVKAKAVDLPGFNGIAFTKMNGVVHIKSGKTNRKLKTIRIKPEATKAGALSSDIAGEKSTGLLVDAIKNELLNTLERNIGRD